MEEEKQLNSKSLISFFKDGCFWGFIYVAIIGGGVFLYLRSCVQDFAQEAHDHFEEIDAKMYEVKTGGEIDGAMFWGTYHISGNNSPDNNMKRGKMEIRTDNTVRIYDYTFDKTFVYAGVLYYDALGGYHIEMSKPIPVAFNVYSGLKSVNTLYIDEQRKFLYFSSTARDAKDEMNRWAMTKSDSNSNSTESVQRQNSGNASNQHTEKGVSASEMVEIGEQYEKGRGREKDLQKAFYYYEKAANAGDPTGLNKMGNMYSLGLGCTRNPATAFYYYKQAAKKGNMYAQYNLANCYWAGNGVEENKDLAIMWFRRSAAQGYKPARIFLQNIEEE